MTPDKFMIYDGVNEQVTARVPARAKRILDVGCGSGATGRRVKEKIACKVVGITYCEAEAEMASQCLDKVLVCDLNRFELCEIGQFDCIICSHVLEHLYHPEQLLKQLHKLLLPDGVIVVAVPNPLYWRQRLRFLLGHFEYTEGGLMDETHYRFFDWSTAQALLIDSGFTITVKEAQGGLPLSRFLSRFGKLLDRVALKIAPGLFGFQFVFVCRSDFFNNAQPRKSVEYISN